MQEQAIADGVECRTRNKSSISILMTTTIPRYAQPPMANKEEQGQGLGGRSFRIVSSLKRQSCAAVDFGEAEEGAEEGGAIPAKENLPKKTFSFQVCTDATCPETF
jgi:hypothetical protein